MKLYQKVWALELGPPGGVGKRIEGQTVHFTADYPGKGDPATCGVTLFMPSREVVGALYDRATVCRVLAGYREEGPVEIFAGTSIAGSVQNQAGSQDPSVSWQLSASRAHIARASVSRSWPDVLASEVIDYLRREMGLSADYIELPTDLRYARGHVVEGAPLPQLDDVVRDCGATYSIEGAGLRIYPIGGAAPREAPVWSPASGLLDVAGPDGDGNARATALLRPSVRPGDTIAVRSPRWSGEIKVQSVRHEGRSDDSLWATSIVGVPRV